MEPILEMAKDLAYAIQQDERYIRTQMAQAAADEDEELQNRAGPPYRRHQFHPRPRGPGTGPRQLRGGRLQRQLRRLRGLSLSR